MKLWPEATKLFIDQSGLYRTEQSRRAVIQTLRALSQTKVNPDVRSFSTAELTAFCLGRTGATKELAPATVRQRRSLVKRFYEWSEFNGLVKANPASSLTFTVRPGKNGVQHHTWLTNDQMSTVVDSTGDDLKGRRDRLILMFGLLCGLRRSDIANLRWSQFSADLSTVRVVGKGGKHATLGLPGQLQEELRDWRQTAPAGTDTVLPGFTWHPGFAGQEPQTTVNWDEPIGGHAVWQVVNTVAAKTNIPLKTHDLRRSFAGALDRAGVPVQDIQSAMRHSNLGTTSIYLEANPERAIKATAGLSINTRRK